VTEPTDGYQHSIRYVMLQPITMLYMWRIAMTGSWMQLWSGY